MPFPKTRLAVMAVAASMICASPVLACTADLDDDDAVGFTDLTLLLGAWGPCGEFPWRGCEEDLNDDTEVGFADLTALLGAWGPCTENFDCPQPFSNPEFQQIGLEALGPDGGLNLTNDLYERIERDVTAIRSRHGLEGYLHSCRWVGRELLVGIDPEGPLDQYHALNEFYCGSTVNHWFDGTIVQLVFPCSMNMPALAAQYEAQTEVEYAETNGTIGSSTFWVPTILGGGVWQWTVTISFHDCFDGCDCSKEFIFFTQLEGAPILVDETPVTGPSWCPDTIPGPPSDDVVEAWESLCNY